MILVYLAYAFPEEKNHRIRFRDLEILAYLSLAQCKLKTQQFLEAGQFASTALDKAMEPGDTGGSLDFPSALLALYRRSQAASQRGLFSVARQDLNQMANLIRKMSTAANIDTTQTKQLTSKFTTKYRRQLRVVNQLVKLHQHRSKTMSKRMFTSRKVKPGTDNKAVEHLSEEAALQSYATDFIQHCQQNARGNSNWF